MVIVDDTPAHIREYWMQQNPEYILALLDPAYQNERSAALANKDTAQSYHWRDKLNMLDPSHPKATIPEWVRWSKRKKQQFRCYVLGWHETDWMINKLTRNIQQIGVLTVDHFVAGANGGLTTDLNTTMLAEIVNNKKGSKVKTYEDMREHFYSVYEQYIPSPEEMIAIQSFRANKIAKVKL